MFSIIFTKKNRNKKSKLIFIFYIFIFFNFLFCTINTFNIDTKHAQIHRRLNTGFGYSVDFAYASQKRDKFTLLVGAPFAQTSQQGLLKAGAVYSCETDQSTCAEIFFDRKNGNENRLNGSHLLPIEEKSNQMFGATIIASKNGDSVLACAPHYKYFFSKFEVVEPVGTCFYAQNYFTKIQEFAPCRQEPAKHGHHRFGYGMCGFSAAISNSKKNRLFISGPGVWYWQGAVFSQNVNNVTDRLNTFDGPANTDHNQLGYSTAVGDFNGDDIDDVIVGVPRGNDLIGMVSIYTETLQPIINLTDTISGQQGQYFGASLAVADLNKDGLADLIVGSPFYTDYKSVDAKTQERKSQYDIGKVYVYIQDKKEIFKKPILLFGHKQWGRFGQAISSAGDLNGDGFEDIIIGAPFDGKENRGAIYVYHGSKDGIRTKYTQKIDAYDVHRDLQTFGFALKGGRDIDHNNYPDVAIGAFQSSQAVILKTRPVMQITGFLKTNRKTINLNEKLCTTEFGRMSCEKIKFCLKFDGKLQPQFNTANIKIKFQIDSKKKISPRAFVLRKDLEKKRGMANNFIPQDQIDKFEQILTLSKGLEHCENYIIYVPDTIRDKISPIIVSVNYTYIEDNFQEGNLIPAPDTTILQTFETELIIEKDCGDDNVCIPNLSIYVEKPTKNITIGTDQTLTLNVTIANDGEDSYLTQFYITIPEGFEYSGIETYENKHKVSCSPHETKSKNLTIPYIFVCDVGNPLPANDKSNFGLKITGHNIDLLKDFVEIKMSVNSAIQENPKKEFDNEYLIHVPIEMKTQLYLTGRSNPEQIDYSIRNRSQGTLATFDFEIGQIVSHLFQVRNRGPSIITNATLDIIWPSYSDDGKNLLYLIDMPYINNPNKAKCRVIQGKNINPASLAISGVHLQPPDKNKIENNWNNSKKNLNKAKFYKSNNYYYENQYNNQNEIENNVNNNYNYENFRLKRQINDFETKRYELKQQKQELKKAVLQAKEAGIAIDYRGQISRSTLNCHSLNCTQITCDINNLAEDEFVLVEIFSRLWVNTLIDNNIYEAGISSLAIAQITSLPRASKFIPFPQIVAVTTTVNPTDPEQQSEIPWWLIILAILIALLILSCIIFCCWKCGFFKRNRPHLEKAKLSKGNAPRAAQINKGYGNTNLNNEYYADNNNSYNQYSQNKHGYKM